MVDFSRGFDIAGAFPTATDRVNMLRASREDANRIAYENAMARLEGLQSYPMVEEPPQRFNMAPAPGEVPLPMPSAPAPAPVPAPMQPAPAGVYPPGVITPIQDIIARRRMNAQYMGEMPDAPISETADMSMLQSVYPGIPAVPQRPFMPSERPQPTAPPVNALATSRPEAVPMPGAPAPVAPIPTPQQRAEMMPKISSFTQQTGQLPVPRNYGEALALSEWKKLQMNNFNTAYSPLLEMAQKDGNNEVRDQIAKIALSSPVPELRMAGAVIKDMNFPGKDTTEWAVDFSKPGVLDYTWKVHGPALEAVVRLAAPRRRDW